MSYQRETKEYQPFRVKLNKVKVLEGVEVALLSPGSRPVSDTEWAQPVTLDGELCVKVDGFGPASWNVWVRVTSSITDEVPVMYCGNFEVT